MRSRSSLTYFVRALFFVVLSCPLAVAANALSEEAPPPACNVETAGRFWPEAANSDPSASQSAARRGELKLCSRQKGKYAWRNLTIHWTALLPDSAERREAPRVGSVPKMGEVAKAENFH